MAIHWAAVSCFISLGLDLAGPGVGCALVSPANLGNRRKQSEGCCRSVLLKAVGSGCWSCFHGALLCQELQIRLHHLGNMTLSICFCPVCHGCISWCRKYRMQEFSQNDTTKTLTSTPLPVSYFLVGQCPLTASWWLSVNHGHRGCLGGSSLSLAGQAVFLYIWQHSGHYPASMLKRVVTTGSHRRDLLCP